MNKNEKTRLDELAALIGTLPKQRFAIANTPSELRYSSSEIAADKNEAHNYRVAAEAIAQSRYAGKPPVQVIVDKTGETIFVAWAGIKHSLRDGTPSWEESLPALHIEEILKGSEKMSVEPDRLGRKDPFAIHRYRAQVAIDGGDYDVVMVVREHQDGKRFYDHSVIQKKTPVGLPESQRDINAVAQPAPPFAGADLTISQSVKKFTPSAVTDALKTLAGNATVQALIDGGTLRVVGKQSQLPASIVIPAGQRVAGAVDPQTGVVYLIAENIAPGEIEGFLTHEVGVHQKQLGLNQPKSRALRLAHALARLVGARQLLGEPTFQDALAQLQRMRATSKPVQAAYAAAEQAMKNLNQSPELLNEEALAYLVQNHPQTRLAQKIIAAVRAFLYRAGLKINLTENDLQALAVSALRSAARGPGAPITVSKGVMGRNTQDVEAQRQYDAVVARYTNPDGTKKDGWMKAPNGQPTKLTERQWVQVRTENFKQWFGDWEGITKRKALDAMPATRLDDVDLVRLEGKALRDEVTRRYNGFKGQSVTTVDGRAVRFTRVGLREVKQHSADRSVLELLAKADQVLKQAIPLWSLDHPPKKVGDSIRAWHYYGAKVALNGKEFFARMVLREDVNGNIYYDNDLSSVESVSGRTGDASRSKTGAAVVSAGDHSLGAWYQSVNPEAASQVVDKNGEPLVVYHGTGKRFNKINFKKGAQGLFWFTANRADIEAGNVGAQGSGVIMPLFANIRNPANRNQYDNLTLGEFRGRGLDGALLSDTGFVLESPTQIKSAIGNTGAFSPNNPDIRFAAASRPYTPEQQAAMDKIGRREPQGWGQRFAGLRERIGLKLRQAVADQHAALLDLDRQAYGAGVVENDTAASSWVKARLSRSVDGPMHLLLHESGLRMDADGALDAGPAGRGSR